MLGTTCTTQTVISDMLNDEHSWLVFLTLCTSLSRVVTISSVHGHLLLGASCYCGRWEFWI